MKKIGMMMIAAIALMAVAAAASAVPVTAASTQADQQILQARYDLASANVNFMTGVMGDVVSLIPQASDLNSSIAKLNSDLSSLQGYVSASDTKGYNAFVKDTLTSDMSSARDALRGDRNNFKSWNVTLATKEKLLADFQSRRSTYSASVSNAYVALGNARLTIYNDEMSRADSQIASMSAKGFDVSGMQTVEGGAKSNVIAPLQSAVNSGNGDTVKQQLKSTCLDNGAPYSYHYAANMDLARLKAITEKLSTSNNTTIQGQVADVNAKLSTVSATLQSVGTSPYSGDQEKQVWDGLKSASQELKDLIQGMNAGKHRQG